MTAEAFERTNSRTRKAIDGPGVSRYRLCMILSYRLSVAQLENDADFDVLLAFLKRHRSVVDELSLFTEYWHHGYFPLDRFASRAATLGRRIAQFRQEGFPIVGINMLDTPGHLDEAWDFLPPFPFQVVIGHDGTVSTSSACVNTPEFSSYILEKYRLIAHQRPSFIWIDDDVRMKSHGRVAFACFCPTCLDLFAQRSGEKARSREELVEDLNKPEAGKLRQAWIQFNGRTLGHLLEKIEQAVHAIDPQIDLGFMSVYLSAECSLHQYSGLKIPRAMEILGGKRVRPGGGFYDDNQPRLMIGKAFAIAEQCENLPPRVDNILYELENFPYQKLSKSVRTVLNECTLALASGCNGIAFNALKDLPGSHADYDDLFFAIKKEKPFWQALTEACAPLAPAGIWCAYSDDVLAKREVIQKDWFHSLKNYDVAETYSWAAIGLPLSRERKNSCATLLSGRIVEAFSDEELRGFLGQGLIMDVESLQILWKRGLGPLTGVKPGKSYDNGVWERFTSHTLNGAYAGDGRDSRVSFWPAQAQELIPLSDATEELTELIGFDFSQRGAALTIFENELRGRVVVMGYCPWSLINSSAKRWQLLELSDWASRKTVPVRIDRTLRLTPFVRTSADGKELLAVLLNTAYDPTGEFGLKLRGRFATVSHLSPEGKWIALPASIKNEETSVAISDLPPWQLTVIKGNSP